MLIIENPLVKNIFVRFWTSVQTEWGKTFHGLRNFLRYATILGNNATTMRLIYSTAMIFLSIKLKKNSLKVAIFRWESSVYLMQHYFILDGIVSTLIVAPLQMNNSAKYIFVNTTKVTKNFTIDSVLETLDCYGHRTRHECWERRNTCRAVITGLISARKPITRGSDWWIANASGCNCAVIAATVVTAERRGFAAQFSFATVGGRLLRVSSWNGTFARITFL